MCLALPDTGMAQYTLHELRQLLATGAAQARFGCGKRVRATVTLVVTVAAVNRSGERDMCLGIPMRVLAATGFVAHCTGREGERRIDTSLVGELAPGEWLLAHLGVARRALSEEEAAGIDLALDALEAAASGEIDIAKYFPDLAGHAPELPQRVREEP
jgi:hydrogenase expression/formation protein HypC